jgi:hypothetical protein
MRVLSILFWFALTSFVIPLLLLWCAFWGFAAYDALQPHSIVQHGRPVGPPRPIGTRLTDCAVSLSLAAGGLVVLYVIGRGLPCMVRETFGRHGSGAEQ